MSNSIHKAVSTAVRLPDDVVPTTVKGMPKYQAKANEHPYWDAFADGFVRGFKAPFAALFSVVGTVGCTTGGPYKDLSAGDSKSLDAHGETGGEISKTDASADGQVQPLDVQPEDAELDVFVDVEDGATDVAQDLSEDATVVDGQELPLDEVSSEIEDASLDTVTDIPEDVTLSDASEDVADAADLPQDVTADVDDASDVYDSGICQYFCDAGITDTTDASDAILPQDATPATDTSEPPVGVPSKMCTGPAGTEKLFAPPNSVAVACTNSAINALILGGNSCVAECGFYDNNVILSTAPNAPVPFSTALFAPPEVTKQSYTVTLALHAPVFANSKTPALPGFMGSSFVFVYKAESFENTGYSQWDAKDVDAVGKLNGNVRITYKPYDYVYDTKEFLDITYSDISGKKVTYSYPCDQLSNPIVNCVEVK